MNSKHNIIKAETAGFCFGVKRAIDIAYETAQKYKNKQIYTLGQIIHNRQMVEKLENSGIKVVYSLDKINPDDVLIIRSHGISNKILNEAIRKGITIVDATCPFVKNAKDYAIQLEKENYTIVVVGDREHPEIDGVVSSLKQACIVVKDKSELQNINIEYFNKLGLIAQTTLRYSVFAEVMIKLVEFSKEAKIFNTICDATFKRQQAALELTKKVDVMIVIGGKNSSNTKKLAEICQSQGLPTYHIETKEELNTDELQNYKNIGVTAGASTPDWIIDDVMNFLENLD